MYCGQKYYAILNFLTLCDLTFAYLQCGITDAVTALNTVGVAQELRCAKVKVTV